MEEEGDVVTTEAWARAAETFSARRDSKAARAVCGRQSGDVAVFSLF